MPKDKKPNQLPDLDSPKPKRLLKKSDPITPPEPQAQKPNNQKFNTLLTFFSILLVISLVIVIPALLFISWFLTSFSSAAGTSPQSVISSISESFSMSPNMSEGRTNILILGTDEIVGQKEGSLLTDTIIVASINYSSHQITLLSLPRDLWIEAFKTKINAIYYYGEISDETTGQEFASTVISQIIGDPIHHTIIINLESLEEFINTLGGVEVDVPQAFTDDKFPRSDIDISTTSDPELLYETITFEKGPQHMDGITALKFIRSRQSSNQEEGTDLARSSRQQLLINSIIHKTTDLSIAKNPHILGNLYKIFRGQITTTLSDSQLLSMIKTNGLTFPLISTLSLAIQEEGQSGLITNPPLQKHDQWVYEPVDPSWNQIIEYWQNSK